MVSVSAESREGDSEVVFGIDFNEVVEGFEREGVVTFIAARHDGDEGKIMPVLSDDDVVIPVAELPCFLSGVITPFCRGSRVKPLMFAFVYPVFPAVAGRLPP